MSTLYKRNGSPYYWWSAVYKGRRVSKSTKMTKRQLAKQVKDKWDLNLILENLDFLGLSQYSPTNVDEFVNHYLKFIAKWKSSNTLIITKGVLTKLQSFLSQRGITWIDKVTTKVIYDYIDWLTCSPKTKKNHLGIISLMFDHAMREEVIQINPTKQVKLPKIEKVMKHRLLEPVDIEIIFSGAGSWSLYYNFLYYTGLRAGDVAMLTHGNIDFSKKAIVSFIRKSRRIHESPLSKVLLAKVQMDMAPDKPLFPDLYTTSERRLNDNLLKPRKFLQALLKSNDRPIATLHSFRVTFNNTLRDLGLSIEDRQILLAHSSSETTKIYTHPNFELAMEYINRMPSYPKPQAN